MTISLKGMTRRELQALAARVEKAIAKLVKADKKKALEAASAAAKAHGFSLADLTGGAAPGPKNGRKTRKSGPKNPPKYRHPSDATITWTGRGRRPDWIKDALAKGRKLANFEIK